MPSMTRANLVTRIGQLINDPSDQRFTASQKQDEIQKAQEMFVLDTKCLKDVSTITIVSGTNSYALPTDILDVMRVAHKNLKLERLSEYELDVIFNADWTVTTGTPTKYYIDLDPNNQKIILYPIPQSADAGANLTIEYIKIPPTLSSDSSVPLDSHTLLIPYHDALAYWAAASLLSILPDQAALVEMGQYMKKYDEYVEHCINTFKGLEQSRPINIYYGRNPFNIGR